MTTASSQRLAARARRLVRWSAGAVVSESAAALLAVRRVERTPDNGRGGGFGRFGDDGIAGHAHAVSRFVRHGRLPSGL